MINRRLIQELRQDMKSLPEFRGLDLSPRNVREYLASKILNEMTEKEKTGGRINEKDMAIDEANSLVKNGVAVLYAPDMQEDEIQSKLEQLLGYDNSPEEDKNGSKRERPWVYRISSINPDIYSSSLRQISSSDDRPLAAELAKKLKLK